MRRFIKHRFFSVINLNEEKVGVYSVILHFIDLAHLMLRKHHNENEIAALMYY